MFVTLFRHGEKSNIPSVDPNLSSRGKGQALVLLRLIKDQKITLPKIAFSSPKKRTQETLIEACNHFKIPLVIQNDLDEQNPYESGLHFRKRVESFQLFLEAQEGPLALCTHYDWILEFLSLPNIEAPVQNEGPTSGAYFVFEIKNQIWNLKKEGYLDDHS